uniref:Serine/threonine-protein phosphatase 5 n=1 Tax=Arundo donax TaxID=35708 RepID=A0A0A9EDD9_ARUDO
MIVIPLQLSTKRAISYEDLKTSTHASPGMRRMRASSSGVVSSPG